MMGTTHRAFSGVFLLGSTLAVNWVSSGYWATSNDEPPIHPAVIVAGFFIAPWFSAGRYLSPDIDHRWAPGPPRQNYHWRFHRGFTHRVWFASVLTVVSLALYGVLLRTGVPASLAAVAFAPVNGWWSHLAGDMIYGRIKVGVWSWKLGRFWHWNVGLGWRTGGLSETGRPSSGGSALVIDPAAKVCTLLVAALAGAHLVLLAG